MATLDPAVVAEAQERQNEAALDDSPRVRVIAGPGTGKSRAISARVRHLLTTGVRADELMAVSFTNAAVRDLREGIWQHCEENGVDPDGVAVTTLHSVALSLLRKGGLLGGYPVEPRVLHESDLREVIDEEFKDFGGTDLRRARKVREHYEAVANTGDAPPPYLRPDPPVTDAEATAFAGFLQNRRLVYGCVLPGELVLQCVQNVANGAIEPVSMLGLRQLIVDEYQDLNPVDAQFVDLLINRGVTTFVCGDDDQSLYSFRHASPTGLQTFDERNDPVSDGVLASCFRCAPEIMHAALAVIENYASPRRIPKHYISVWSSSTPVVDGVAGKARYAGEAAEARGIARTCQRLIAGGSEGGEVPPQEICVLMSNQRVQTKRLYQAMEEAGVPYVPARPPKLVDTAAGQAAEAMLRAVCHPDDLVARRILFGLLPGVGAARKLALVDQVLAGGVGAQQIWELEDASDILDATVEKPRSRVAQCLNQHHAAGIEGASTLADVGQRLSDSLGELFGEPSVDAFKAAVESFPEGAALAEVLAYHHATAVDSASAILAGVYRRLELEPPLEAEAPAAVRFMSIHGSKGLSFDVVFVPGLEEGLLPSDQATPVPAQVQEAARLLYVAITRARAGILLSYSGTRMVNGQFQGRAPSQLVAPLGNFMPTDERGHLDEIVDRVRRTRLEMQ